MNDPVSALRGFIERPFSAEARNSQFLRPLGIENRSLTDPDRDRQDKKIRDHFSSFLEFIFGSQPANPNRLDTIERMDAIFSTEAYRSERSKYENYSGFVSDIERILSSQDRVALVGPRGSGKTILFNKWLNDRTKLFIESVLRSNWFRIDVTKLYDLKRSTQIRPGSITISNYFIVHTAYVLLEYGGALPSPYASGEKGYSEVLGAITKHIQDSEDAAEFQNAIQQISKYYDTLRALESTKRFPSETLIAELFKNHGWPFFVHFDKVFSLFCKHSDELDVGIIAVIDGLDNVSWSMKNNHYIELCTDTKRFLENFEALTKIRRRKTVIVARPETIPEIEIRLISDSAAPAQATMDRVQFFLIEMPEANVELVLQKKFEAGQHSKAFAFAREACMAEVKRAKPEGDEKSEFNALFREYANSNRDFLSTLCRELNTVLAEVPSNPAGFFLSSVKPEELCRVAFDGNVRAVVDCFRRAKEGRSASERLNIIHAADSDRLPEYFLLSGRFFLDSQSPEDKEVRYSKYRLDVFPNIFWYDNRDSGRAQSHWHGLCGLRLLQLANTRTLPAADVMYFLSEAFGYSPKIIAEHVEAFVAFGLLNVDFKRVEEPSFCPKDLMPFAEYKNFVRTSYKGRMVASLALYYFDWMYFEALDTPLHSFFLKDVRGDKFVKFYRDPASLAFRHNFLDASTMTIPVFARHIWFYHNTELTSLRQRAGIVNQKFKGLFQETNALPTLFSISEAWLAFIGRKLDRRLKQRQFGKAPGYDELVADVLGNTSKEVS